MAESSITVLTYDHPHRKTQDVIWRLMSAGKWGELRVVATPWKERKPRKYLYAHRPAEHGWPCEPVCDQREFCHKLGLPFALASSPEDLLGALSGVVVVGGAGILPAKVVTEFLVVNVHPGLLPARRGLDVLKWAIVDCKQVGVTAHICDEHTDLGWRIIEREVPVFRQDTFHSFAMRQYEYELGLIPAAVQRVIDSKTRDHFEVVHPGETTAFRRMPLSVEAGLLEAFERYKLVYGYAAR